jgi:HAD superfamily hydrolase (TIGR01509 family)
MNPKNLHHNLEHDKSIEYALIQTEDSDIKGIILDFDGVLSSFEERIGTPLINSALKVKKDISDDNIKRGSLKVLRMLTTIDSMPKKTTLAKFVYKMGREVGMTRLQSLRFVITSAIVYKRQHHTIIPTIGVHDALKELINDNYKIILLTNTSNKVIKKASEKIPEINDFDLILTRDAIKKLKPDPAGFHKALEVMGLKPEEVVSVGDQASDILASKRAGIRTVAVNNDKLRHFKPQLIEFNPEFIIEDMRQLPELLRSIRDKIIEDIKMTIDLTEKSLHDYFVDGSLITQPNP